MVYYTRSLRRGGRVVECNGLENRRGLIAHREFESLLLRHFICADVVFIMASE